MSATLSADAKDALAREAPGAEHCRLALRDGLAYYGTAPGGTRFRTQRPAVARLMWSLLDDRKGRPIVRRTNARLTKQPSYEIDLGSVAPLPKKPGARCDRRMELRAAFLACGSLASPARGYHLEFVPPSAEGAERLVALLRGEGLAAKTLVRKGRPLVYFKDIDAIAAALGAIGAFGAVLHLEDVRALKETKNRIHRLVNTEAANVDRAANAAAAQREAILYLADAYGLGNLRPALREIAELRLANPTETLADLGRRCVPPAGKSTVNNRLAALVRLAGRAGERLGAVPDGEQASATNPSSAADATEGKRAP